MRLALRRQYLARCAQCSHLPALEGSPLKRAPAERVTGRARIAWMVARGSSALLHQAEKPTLFCGVPVVALTLDARTCNSIANLRWFQAVQEIGHFYCQGLGQWTALDNNSADFLESR